MTASYKPTPVADAVSKWKKSNPDINVKCDFISAIKKKYEYYKYKN